MRKLIVKYLQKLITKLSPPEPTRDPIQEITSAIDRVNEVMPYLPKRFSLWVDWEERPPALILRETDYTKARKVVYPAYLATESEDAY